MTWGDIPGVSTAYKVERALAVAGREAPKEADQ
jgi:hypothetical protein